MKTKLSYSKKRFDFSAQQIRIDGLSDVVLAEIAIKKLLYVVLIIIGSCFCCYLVVDSIFIYLKYDVVTNVRQITQVRAEFPTIMICNMNSLNSDYYVRMLKDANITDYSLAPYFNMVALEEYQKRTTNSYLTIEQKRAMFEEDGFIISCTFNNRPCNKSQISYVYNPYFLNCIQFNADHDLHASSIYKTSLSGEYAELTMELYVGMPNELSEIPIRGVFVKAINSTEDPFKNTPIFINITPRYASKIEIKKNIFKQFNGWPYLYSGCNVNEDGTLIQPIKDHRFFDMTSRTNYTYAQETCLFYCGEYHSRRICNCSAQWLPYPPEEGYDKCMSKDNKCVNDFYYTVFRKGDYIEKNCVEHCPHECQMHKYEWFQSIYAYPKPDYLENTLKKNPMLISRYSTQTDFTERLAQNVVKFSIIADTSSHKETRQEPKVTWTSLLASLGGHLHLFLGMSFICFLELFELTISKVFSIFRI